MKTEPRATGAIAEIVHERAQQDAKWGVQNHPDLPKGIVSHPCAFFGLPTADAAREHCEDAFKRGAGSYAHIFVEEVCEAIEDAHDPAKLRAELVQVAAVAAAWIEKIDRDAHSQGAG